MTSPSFFRISSFTLTDKIFRSPALDLTRKSIFLSPSTTALRTSTLTSCQRLVSILFTSVISTIELFSKIGSFKSPNEPTKGFSPFIPFI